MLPVWSAQPLTPGVDLVKEIRREERPTRRGELGAETSALVCCQYQRDKGGIVPLVHVQVARHVGGQAGGG